MIPPPKANVFEFPTSTIWFDDNGILCSVSKNVAPQSIEEVKSSMLEFRKIIFPNKVCLLSDSTDSVPVNKEMRDLYAELIPQIAKAVAVISRSAVSTMATNLFFSLKSQPYPVKMFTQEIEAKEWLKQYL